MRQTIDRPPTFPKLDYTKRQSTSIWAPATPVSVCFAGEEMLSVPDSQRPGFKARHGGQ